MLTVLRLSDKRVRQKLLDRVQCSRQWVVVAMVHHGPQMREVEEREPFATLLEETDRSMELVVVLDEDTAEGMWRDPVGDLAELLYPDDKSQAALAAHGYFIIRNGKPVAVVKKSRSAKEDAKAIGEALGGRSSSSPSPKATRSLDSSLSAAMDPYQRLGIARGTPLAQARKAFRALVTQYHPDKVAHLAPEFRALAEERTRELMAAWEKIVQEHE